MSGGSSGSLRPWPRPGKAPRAAWRRDSIPGRHNRALGARRGGDRVMCAHSRRAHDSRTLRAAGPDHIGIGGFPWVAQHPTQLLARGLLFPPLGCPVSRLARRRVVGLTSGLSLASSHDTCQGVSLLSLHQGHSFVVVPIRRHVDDLRLAAARDRVRFRRDQPRDRLLGAAARRRLYRRRLDLIQLRIHHMPHMVLRPCSAVLHPGDPTIRVRRRPPRSATHSFAGPAAAGEPEVGQHCFRDAGPLSRALQVLIPVLASAQVYPSIHRFDRLQGGLVYCHLVAPRQPSRARARQSRAEQQIVDLLQLALPDQGQAPEAARPLARSQIQTLVQGSAAAEVLLHPAQRTVQPESAHQRYSGNHAQRDAESDDLARPLQRASVVDAHPSSCRGPRAGSGRRRWANPTSGATRRRGPKIAAVRLGGSQGRGEALEK